MKLTVVEITKVEGLYSSV